MCIRGEGLLCHAASLSIRSSSQRLVRLIRSRAPQHTRPTRNEELTMPTASTALRTKKRSQQTNNSQGYKRTRPSESHMHHRLPPIPVHAPTHRRQSVRPRRERRRPPRRRRRRRPERPPDHPPLPRDARLNDPGRQLERVAHDEQEPACRKNERKTSSWSARRVQVRGGVLRVQLTADEVADPDGVDRGRAHAACQLEPGRR